MNRFSLQPVSIPNSSTAISLALNFWMGIFAVQLFSLLDHESPRKDRYERISNPPD